MGEIRWALGPGLGSWLEPAPEATWGNRRQQERNRGAVAGRPCPRFKGTGAPGAGDQAPLARRPNPPGRQASPVGWAPRELQAAKSGFSLGGSRLLSGTVTPSTVLYYGGSG